jgi:hypothetical protein
MIGFARLDVVLPHLRVVTHPVGIAADVDDVAVMQDAVDESRGHHFVAKHSARRLVAARLRHISGTSLGARRYLTTDLLKD